MTTAVVERLDVISARYVNDGDGYRGRKPAVEGWSRPRAALDGSPAMTTSAAAVAGWTSVC